MSPQFLHLNLHLSYLAHQEPLGNVFGSHNLGNVGLEGGGHGVMEERHKLKGRRLETITTHSWP